MKVNGPLCSVVMPAFNCQETIRHAICSVLSQTESNFEIIICEDSSEDNTWDVISSFQDPRIVKLRNTTNSGAAFSRNRCLSRARGRYIFFIDADDLWGEDAIYLHVMVHRKEKPGITYGPYHIIDQEGKKIGYFCPPKSVNKNTLLRTCDFGLSTVCVDRALVGDFAFPETFKEDYALWLLLSKRSSVKPVRVSDLQCSYRVGHKSLSSNKLKEIFRQWKVVREYGEQGCFASFFYITCYIYSGLVKHFVFYRKQYGKQS